MTLATLTELTSSLYTADLVDETGAAVSGASLDTLTLTVYDVDTGTILNSRSQQNVKNVNGVTISAGGALVWTIAPADVAIIDDTKQFEQHVALFEGVWATTKKFKHEIPMLVRNVVRVS